MPRLGWAPSSRGLRCPLVSRVAVASPETPAPRAPLHPRPVGAARGSPSWGAGGGPGQSGARSKSVGEGPAGATTRFPLAFGLISPLNWVRAASGPERPVYSVLVKKSWQEQKEKQSLFFSKNKASTAVLASFNVESQMQQRKQNSSTWQQQPLQWEKGRAQGST